MKTITKSQFEALLKNGILKNTNDGVVDKNGNSVGFYRTANKRYVEDRIADMAQDLSQ